MHAGLKSLSSRRRRLLLTFGLITLVPAIGVVWLGATFLQQDRELAEKQLTDNLERKADAIAADLARDIARPAATAAAVPLTYGAATAAVWQAGDRAERQNQFDTAVREYARLSRSEDPQLRAEAQIRMARVLRKADRSDEALAIYADLNDEDDVLFLGAPVSLWAALAAVDELGDRGLIDRQHAAAAAIRKDLRQGRWKIDGPTVEMAWSQVTAPAMFADEWQTRWRDDGVVVRLSDPATGKPIIDVGVLATPSVIRTAADAKLPWTVQVASAAAANELDAFAGRRQTLVLVLALAMFLVLAGAYFVARGIRRELAVAELQSKFVSAVSHEFRTPLTSMSHLIELLRDRAHLDDARRARYYDALEQEAERLRRFVDRLLDFGRVDAGAAQYRFEPTAPAELVSRLVDQFRGGPSAQDHPVGCEIAAGLPDVSIDRESFALAFNNLLENAAKYSPAGSPIVVDVAVESAGRRLAIQVRDRGPGIPRAEQERIFDKFVRGAAAQASGIRGTGVGLALARDIMRAHGGDIAVESEPGAGSTFTILLPVGGAPEPDRVPRTGAVQRA